MSQALFRYLGTGSSLASLQAHAERLGRLQRQVAAALPHYLAGLCHVANLREDTLLIHADNGAVAAKLRQATPSLLATLAREGVLLAGIKVATRPRHAAPAARAPTLRGISEDTGKEMRALAEQLPEDAPLRAALERFVARSRREDEIR